ncbi:hypothetical protein C2845_PM16G04470 [Panicum miliaceum]|uniref:Uncharacterized protein n=1 Tax=Panicum miliaceum TaxID=4540 RepID=A0A3L6PS82_PANMI|nr:hypothetical protein C2845_PM16G04470 [Panicum miliaceum]
MHSTTSSGGGEDCSLSSESLQVDSGEPRRRLHANAERNNVEGRASGELGRAHTIAWLLAARSCRAFSASSCARSSPYWRLSSETARSPAEERPAPATGELSRKRSRMDSTEGWPKEKALPATSALQRMESSLAFLEKPCAAFGEAHLTCLIALNAPDLDFLPAWRLPMHVADRLVVVEM